MTFTSAIGNPILDAIDSGRAWAGEVTYNRVDPQVVAETTAFSTALPSPYETAGLGLTNAMWDLVARTLPMVKAYVGFTYAITDAVDANYFVSDFINPNSVNTAGIAARPGATPILAYNRQTWDTYSDQQQDWIVVHELGHTLGLQHPAGLPAELDYSQYTVMSYNWYDLGIEDYGEGLPLTFMALDVAVLQAKYGAASANVGATTYALSNLTLDLDGADGVMRNGGGYICIWDSGGTDVLTYGGASGALLNLNTATLKTTAFTGGLADVIGDIAATSRLFARMTEATKAEITDPVRTAGGFFSSLLTQTERDHGGYTIANGAQIENATGGDGADLIVGNELRNVLIGNAGADELYGGDGGDSLDGGIGDDRLFGGQGADTLADTGAGANYLRGDEGDDSIAGGAGFDDINGNAGNDTCVSGGGDDWVVGGKDNDSLAGSAGQNLVYGNLGADTCEGGGGDDIVRGGQQDDILFGGAGNDYLSGDRDNDTITGGAGADLFHTFGEAGIDRVLDFSVAEGDRIQLDPGTQYSFAQIGADTVISMTGGGQMILVDVQASSLTAGWIFGA